MAPAEAARLFAVGVMLVGMGGCSGEGGGDAKIDVVEILEETSAFQRSILEDGVVTFAEYEQATLAAIDCVESGAIDGLSVVGPHPRDGDPRFLEWGIEWEGAVPEEEFESLDARMSRLMSSCEEEYSLDVSRVWSFQNVLTPEERDRKRPLVIRCLQDAGIDLSDQATTAEVYRAVADADPGNEQVRQCHREHVEFFTAGAG